MFFNKQQPVDKIVVVPDPRLSAKCAPTSLSEVKKLNLVERLKKATPTAWTKGYGLAAVQIGVPLRFAWFKIADKEYTLLNPVILKQSEAVVIGQEGCLSIPDKRFRTLRYNRIVYASEHSGRIEHLIAEGMVALIIQHEVDHMDGMLCPSRVTAQEQEPGRNAPCPCGSGKKYKKCCIDKGV